MGCYARAVMVLSVLAMTVAVAAQPAYVWREAETADEANFELKTSGGPPEVVSEGKLLVGSLTDQEVAEGKIGAGRQLVYNLKVAQAGSYHLWIRLGLEFVRAPLNWRIDQGEWKTISPQDLTTNLIALGTWYEIGWYDCGALDLTAGAHVLELLADKPNGKRFILALDVIALVQGNWQPDGPLKPGEEPDGDLDRQAAQQVFQFPASEDTSRQALSLKGVWQIARFDDPDMDQGTYEPVREVPAALHWRGIQVPSDLKASPLHHLAHRVWYRTRVQVPASLAGRSFSLHFGGTNWIASVLVNGQFVGWHKSTRIPWACDITSALKPGQINEIWIGIKDSWYAIDAQYHKVTLDERRNLPMADQSFLKWTRFVAPLYPSTKGDTDGTLFGITDPVSLVSTGPVYVENVFVQTGVASKQITAQVRLRNSTDRAVEAAIRAEAVLEGSGQVEKALPPATVQVPAGATATVTLSSSWPEAKLWWPWQDPASMYRLHTTVSVAGAPTDTDDQRFGFREVTLDGIYVRINGVRCNFWNLLGGLDGDTPELALAHFRKGNNRFERFSADLGLGKLLGPRSAQLDWTDTHGIPGRLSTMVDGMFINYDLRNPVTWENFAEHTAQVVEAYRNHPSIVVYSLENELLLINGRLGYAGIMDQVEANARKYLVDVAHGLDPTRPCMLDGGGALADNSVEINCLHYAEAAHQYYPENAYTLERYDTGTTRNGAWWWDRKRPLVMGEMSYFSGTNASWAWVGGDSVFMGRDEARKGFARYLRSLMEGYRWNDVAMFFPWGGMDGFEDCWISMAPVAAFVREQNGSFFGGTELTRTLKVFNDTLSPAPVKFTWSLEMNARRVLGGTQTLTIEPGFSQQVSLSGNLPQVTQRTSAQLVLEASQEGAPAFRDVKQLAFFPQGLSLSLKRPLFVLEAESKLTDWLKGQAVAATQVTSLAAVTAPDGLVLVGADFLQPGQSVADFVRYAQGGGRVIFLEQENPIEGAELPTPLKVLRERRNNREVPGSGVGAGYAFAQGLGTPMLAGLGAQDFSNWAGDPPTVKRMWVKPTGGGRSWVECGDNLDCTALVEMPCGKGQLVATQLRLGAKLEVEPAARVLLANMLRYADGYEPPSRSVVVWAPDRPDITRMVADLHCRQSQVTSLQEALDPVAHPVLVLSASRRNLEALLALRPQLDRYTEGGGWVMLWGLEPDGLDAYNSLLGTHHLMRPFRMERVTVVPDQLMAGLGNRDVVQYSADTLAAWTGDKWISRDVFTYCVDGADLAPFCRVPNQKDGPYKPTFDDKDPFNWVNGMTGDESWRYIVQIWHGDWPASGSPPFEFMLPLPSKIESVRVWNNANYNTIRDLEVQLDGKRAATMVLPDATALSSEAQLQGATAERSVGLVVRSIRTHREMPLVGIDNVQILRELPDWYRDRVFPLVNVGGLVRYPRGKGGFVLNQVKVPATMAPGEAAPQQPDAQGITRFAEAETPQNVAKKQRTVSILLQNLGVAFEATP